MILYLLYSCYKLISLKSTYISTPITCFLQICSYSSPSIFLHLLFPPIYLHLLHPPLSLLLLLSPYISKPTNCPYISASTHLPLYIYMYCIPPISLNLLIHYRSIPTIHPCISATTPLSPIYLQLSLSLPICLYLLLSPIYPYTSNIYLILSPPTSLPLYPNTHRQTHKF